MLHYPYLYNFYIITSIYVIVVLRVNCVLNCEPKFIIILELIFKIHGQWFIMLCKIVVPFIIVTKFSHNKALVLAQKRHKKKQTKSRNNYWDVIKT